MKKYGCILHGQFFIMTKQSYKNLGASCSKLTVSLVNNSFKFQMAILQIHCYFFIKKMENPLQFAKYSTTNKCICFKKFEVDV